MGKKAMVLAIDSVQEQDSKVRVKSRQVAGYF
jgi:hypothetical protein